MDLQKMQSRFENGLEKRIGQERKSLIDSFVVSIEQLSDIEKLYLYLKLPGGPVNVFQTSSKRPTANDAIAVNWINTHIESHPGTSIQKQNVYNDYKSFCERNGSGYMTISEFGKHLRAAIKKVHPRRLGKRGEAQYMYAGVRFIQNPKPFSMPDISDVAQYEKTLKENEETDDVDCDNEEDDEWESILNQSSWTVVSEWASSLTKVGKKFSSSRELAEYLISNNYVNPKSKEALILSALEKKSGETGETRILPKISKDDKESNAIQPQTRENLTKVIHKREEMKEQKRRMEEERLHLSKSETKIKMKPSHVVDVDASLEKNQNSRVPIGRLPNKSASAPVVQKAILPKLPMPNDHALKSNDQHQILLLSPPASLVVTALVPSQMQSSVMPSFSGNNMMSVNSKDMKSDIILLQQHTNHPMAVRLNRSESGQPVLMNQFVNETEKPPDPVFVLPFQDGMLVTNQFTSNPLSGKSALVERKQPIKKDALQKQNSCPNGTLYQNVNESSLHVSDVNDLNKSTHIIRTFLNGKDVNLNRPFSIAAVSQNELNGDPKSIKGSSTKPDTVSSLLSKQRGIGSSAINKFADNRPVSQRLSEKRTKEGTEKFPDNFSYEFSQNNHPSVEPTAVQLLHRSWNESQSFDQEMNTGQSHVVPSGPQLSAINQPSLQTEKKSTFKVDPSQTRMNSELQKWILQGGETIARRTSMGQSNTITNQLNFGDVGDLLKASTIGETSSKSLPVQNFSNLRMMLMQSNDVDTVQMTRDIDAGLQTHLVQAAGAAGLQPHLVQDIEAGLQAHLVQAAGSGLQAHLLEVAGAGLQVHMVQSEETGLRAEHQMQIPNNLLSLNRNVDQGKQPAQKLQTLQLRKRGAQVQTYQPPIKRQHLQEASNESVLRNACMNGMTNLAEKYRSLEATKIFYKEVASTLQSPNQMQSGEFILNNKVRNCTLQQLMHGDPNRLEGSRPLSAFGDLQPGASLVQEMKYSRPNTVAAAASSWEDIDANELNYEQVHDRRSSATSQHSEQSSPMSLFSPRSQSDQQNSSPIQMRSTRPSGNPVKPLPKVAQQMNRVQMFETSRVPSVCLTPNQSTNFHPYSNVDSTRRSAINSALSKVYYSAQPAKVEQQLQQVVTSDRQRHNSAQEYSHSDYFSLCITNDLKSLHESTMMSTMSEQSASYINDFPSTFSSEVEEINQGNQSFSVGYSHRSQSGPANMWFDDSDAVEALLNNVRVDAADKIFSTDDEALDNQATDFWKSSMRGDHLISGGHSDVPFNSTTHSNGASFSESTFLSLGEDNAFI